MTDKNQFVHLHAHTEYSLLDGAAKVVDEKGNPSELIKFAAAQKMPALAITDHGNLYGAIEFYKACQTEGIKPIIGIEAYVAPKSRLDKNSSITASNNHLTLLSKESQGYQNLMKLSSLSFTEGFYYKPRMDWEILEKYHHGLIGMSGCLKGKIAELIVDGKEKEAEETAGRYQEIFGKGNFYLELMDQGIEAQKKVNSTVLEISKRTGVPVVATNDCHYLKKEDAFAHDVLLCIGTQKVLSEKNRLKYSTNEFYYKSAQEMMKLFSEVPQAIHATVEIASRCNLEIKFNQILLPRYHVPQGETMDSYLEKLCLDGVRKRYGQVMPQLKSRLDEELDVIKKMGFSAYFLIVWDFVHFAKTNGIPVGPGRGSGAGSLVSYALEITDIDPMKYELLFERFLNPERREMPDLDIDFSDEGREKVIEYVRQKYGAGSVAQIISFGSMMARSVIRDVGRVFEMPLSDCDRIAKMIPKEIGITISSALKQSPELKALYEDDESAKRLLDVSQKLEGLKRHTSVHAAGIVIAPTDHDHDITCYAPLAKGSKDVVTTQYEGVKLLKLGILKMDFLGLRTLTVLHNAEKTVKERHNRSFNLSKIRLDDQKTYQLLSEAKTVGIFQLESSGMRDLLRKLKPTVFEDIIALVSLYRPGPMGSGMLNDFVARKHEKSKVRFDHPLLEPILKETYGIIVYQEQVMRISRAIAGFSAGQADILRKAMGKKIPEEITKLQKNFLDGAKKNGIDHKIAEKIFAQIEHFGGYGFNKSHATAYALLSYQTAYLKANYAPEYMAALISSEIGHSTISREEGNKLVQYLEDAQNMGIEILPPDAQSSGVYFTLSGVKENTKIRFGLSAVKNVGEGAVEEIVRARESGPFLSFEDFCKRVDTRTVNKKVIESLIKAGAFDFCGEPIAKIRAQLTTSLERVMEDSSSFKEDQSIGQGSLFDSSDVVSRMQEKTDLLLEDFSEWTEHELLAHEKEVLGFYISGHPLAKFKEELKFYSTHSLANLPSNGSIRIRAAGMIENVKRLVSKQNKSPYARFRLEDLEGEVECVVFPKSYANGLAALIEGNKMVVVSGRMNQNEQGENFGREMIVEEIYPLEKARESLIGGMTIYVSTTGLEDSLAKKLKNVLAENSGKCAVRFVLKTPSHGEFSLDPNLKVKLSDDLFKEIKDLLGEKSWRLVQR